MAIAALSIATFLAYARVGGFEFLNYDDPDYVTKNPIVQEGLTLAGLRWAFTSFHAANWHPLTWLSHMLDVELFGLDAGGHHRVNLLLHATNAALLFLMLRSLTRSFWPSFVVAALFALHPLRVQSVAWIAERKDLLSSSFFFATCLAYGRYARSPRAASYAIVVALFALGLLAKPMLVTVPFVLLLLDYWPLGRLGSLRSGPSFVARAPAPAHPSLAPTHPGSVPARTAGAPAGYRLVAEKLPLLVLAAASCVVTWSAQHAGRAVGSIEALPLLERIGNAALAYVAYLRLSVWPAELAVFHPHPSLLANGNVLGPGLGAGLVLVLVSFAFVCLRRRLPQVLVGWLWFLGMLVPVIGIVQVGVQAYADRYAYLPLVGLQIALVFGLVELSPRRGPLLASAACGALVVLAIRTRIESEHWRDSRSLFERALEVTETNWIAHNNLGLVLLEGRELERAEQHFRAAIDASPRFTEAHYNLGVALQAQGRPDEARAAFQAALETSPEHGATLARLGQLARTSGDKALANELLERAVEADPGHAPSWAALARALFDQGDLDRAANCAASAVRLDASLADAHLVLGEVALRRGQLDAAGVHLRESLERAETASAHAALGVWRMRRNELEEARAELERALELQPDLQRAHFDLGALLLNLGDREGAQREFQSLLERNPDDVEANNALAALAIDQGRPADALPFLDKALALKPDFVGALHNQAVAHQKLGNWSGAVAAYRRELAFAPVNPESAREYAWILATGPDVDVVDGEDAVKWASYAVQHMGPRALEVLAAAHARAGGFEEAIRLQTEAIARAQSPAQRAQLEERLALFESGQPYTRAR